MSPKTDNDFGLMLKHWRKHRRYSQLQMAEDTGISSRHISFLETGRSAPSKELILRIGGFLSIPKREINRMLAVSGFAQVFRDVTEPDTDLEPVYFALDTLLENHLPYPAIVLNRNWDLVKANPAAVELMTKIGFIHSNNLIECLLLDDPANSKIINWGETVSILLNRLKAEVDLVGGSDRLIVLGQRLHAHMQQHQIEEQIDYSASTLNTQFNIDGISLAYFSLVSQMGSIMEVTTSEFKVELMFPADEATKKYHQ